MFLLAHINVRANISISRLEDLNGEIIRLMGAPKRRVATVELDTAYPRSQPISVQRFLLAEFD